MQLYIIELYYVGSNEIMNQRTYRIPNEYGLFSGSLRQENVFLYFRKKTDADFISTVSINPDHQPIHYQEDTMHHTYISIFTAFFLVCSMSTAPEPSFSGKTSVTASDEFNFPLVPGNEWVYRRYRTAGADENYTNDTLLLKVGVHDGNQYEVVEKIIVHSDDLKNSYRKYYLSVDESQMIHSSDTSGFFKVPLCISQNCISVQSNLFSYHEHRDESEWEADSVFEYDDPGNTPADGCGGLRFSYTRDKGIICRNDYCGWNVSSQWILQ